jgi:hypothetical protein
VIPETDKESELKDALLELDCICPRHGPTIIEWVPCKARMLGYCSECLRECREYLREDKLAENPFRLYVTPNIVKVKDAE